MGGATPGNLTAFILAGGKSTRMGADKAFIEYEGRTLLAHALQLASSVTDDVRIVGSSKKFQLYGPVVEDIFVDHGPLGGIHSALRNSTTELNLMLAVDMSFVSPPLLRHLAREAQRCTAVAVIPRSAERLQPLCAIYRRDFANVAEAALHAGRNKINPLFGLVDTRIVAEEELSRAGFSPELFRNLNTPQELSEAEMAAGGNASALQTR